MCTVFTNMENVSNLDLFVTLKQGGSIKDNKILFDLIISKLSNALSDDEIKHLKCFCSTYCSNLFKKWLKSGSKGSCFIQNNSEWLCKNVDWPNFLINPQTNESISPKPSTSQELLSPVKSVGTTTVISPRKPFSDLGPKQKKKRVDFLTLPSDELEFAYLKSLRDNGKTEVAKIFEHILKNPFETQKVTEFLFKQRNETLSPEIALGSLTSLKLSKWQYNNLRKTVQDAGANVFPSYYSIQKTKQQCYPCNNDIDITDTSAQIKLQALLDLTAKRILKIIDNNNINDDMKDLQLISKWGFDGASNQSVYKQRGDIDNIDDSSIFMGSLVPIKLVCGDVVLWENEVPNSTFFCRPMFFKFMKENTMNITQEKDYIQSQIDNLKETVCGLKTISHTLMLTMIDGKITSVLSETSSQRCDICKATPKEMNNYELISKKPIDTDALNFGISSLHAWPRFMECILHISYKLDVKSWTTNSQNRSQIESRKKAIQDSFKSRTGLLIDVVKQGKGTTNDGNTARRFFGDVGTTASITGVDENLIRRFSVILECISSGHTINVDKFKEFADDTLHLYNQLYSWYYMPASVHKILVHGKDIIGNLGLIPIGKLSEEASESRNKDFRRYREQHSRKINRKATNEDILNNLLVSSDPYISSIRPKLYRKHKRLSNAAQSLLILNDSFFDQDEPENAAIKENVAFVDVNTIDED